MTESTGGKGSPGINRRYRPAACVAIVEHSHLLMVREGARSKRGQWNLPGGVVDRGEGPIQAGVRETREETGFDVSIHGFGGVYSYIKNSNRPALRFLLFGRIRGGEPVIDGREIIDLRWFHLEQLDALPDAQLWKPGLLRHMLADIRRAAPYPIELLQSFDPLARAA